jgi:hypothetical protein
VDRLDEGVGEPGSGVSCDTGVEGVHLDLLVRPVPHQRQETSVREVKRV